MTASKKDFRRDAMDIFPVDLSGDTALAKARETTDIAPTKPSAAPQAEKEKCTVYLPVGIYRALRLYVAAPKRPADKNQSITVVNALKEYLGME